MKKSLFLLLLLVQHVVAPASPFSSHEENCGEWVVCVHGFMLLPSSMTYVKKMLRSSCFDPYLWSYPSRRRTLEEHGACLVKRLERLAARKPGRPIHFVTHSIGALVLRSALCRSDCPPEAQCGRVVLVAPPNRGSCLARQYADSRAVGSVFGSKTGWQLTHYGPEEMEALGCFPDSVNVLVLAGSCGNPLIFDEPNDGFLTLWETELSTPYYRQVLDLSHGDLLISPTSLLCIRNFLLGDCGS